MLDEFKSAFNRYNNAPAQLIIINVAIFVVLVLLNVISSYTGLEGAFAVLHQQFSLPSPIVEFITRPWTIVTYMFTHDLQGILHILFNMLFLYWFGRLFVEYLGSDKLIAVYVLGGIAGGLAYLLLYNTVAPFRDMDTNLVGASAAVDCIIVATATLLPNYTFYLLFFGPVKIKYIAAFAVFLSIMGIHTASSNVGGNIAHLGGALMGYVYMKQLQAGSNWGIWITVTLDWIKGLFRAKPNVKVSYRKEKATVNKGGGSSPKNPASYTQDEIDAILDKISAAGYESLTKEEKEKLFNASKKR